MQLQAMVVRTGRPWLTEFGYALGVLDRSRLEYFEVVDVAAVDHEAQ